MSCPQIQTHTHCGPCDLNCGISGIQTQSPNGNYQGGGGGGAGGGGADRKGSSQAKNVQRTLVLGDDAHSDRKKRTEKSTFKLLSHTYSVTPV